MTKVLFITIFLILLTACGSEPTCTEPLVLIPDVLEYNAQIGGIADEIANNNATPIEAINILRSYQNTLDQLVDPQNYSNLLRLVNLKLDCYVNFTQQLVNGQRDDYYSIHSACQLEEGNYIKAYDEYKVNCP